MACQFAPPSDLPMEGRPFRRCGSAKDPLCDAGRRMEELLAQAILPPGGSASGCEPRRAKGVGAAKDMLRESGRSTEELIQQQVAPPGGTPYATRVSWYGSSWAARWLRRATLPSRAVAAAPSGCQGNSRGCCGPRREGQHPTARPRTRSPMRSRTWACQRRKQCRRACAGCHLVAPQEAFSAMAAGWRTRHGGARSSTSSGGPHCPRGLRRASLVTSLVQWVRRQSRRCSAAWAAVLVAGGPAALHVVSRGKLGQLRPGGLPAAPQPRHLGRGRERSQR